MVTTAELPRDLHNQPIEAFGWLDSEIQAIPNKTDWTFTGLVPGQVYMLSVTEGSLVSTLIQFYLNDDGSTAGFGFRVLVGIGREFLFKCPQGATQMRILNADTGGLDYYLARMR